MKTRCNRFVISFALTFAAFVAMGASALAEVAYSVRYVVQKAVDDQHVQVKGKVARVLEQDKFILADGGFEILVDLDDDFAIPNLRVGDTVLVMGEVDVEDDQDKKKIDDAQVKKLASAPQNNSLPASPPPPPPPPVQPQPQPQPVTPVNPANNDQDLFLTPGIERRHERRARRREAIGEAFDPQAQPQPAQFSQPFPEPQPPQASSNKSPVVRLKELNAMWEQGLISEQEYEMKKAQILNAL